MISLKKSKFNLQTQNNFLSIFLDLCRLNVCPLYEGQNAKRKRKKKSHANNF